MRVPFSYIRRNLWVRKLTTALTAGGMALVVFVFATVLMLEEGLRKTLVDTGSYDNVVVIRRSAQTEVQSGVDRPNNFIKAKIVRLPIGFLPGVGVGGPGLSIIRPDDSILVLAGRADFPSIGGMNVLVIRAGMDVLVIRGTTIGSCGKQCQGAQ